MSDGLKMRCPSCGSALGDVALLSSEAVRSIRCSRCGFVIAYDEDGWDACVDRAHTRDFSRQWRLWEQGKLGDPTLVYGARPEDSLDELLACTGLAADDLQSMRVLEVGFGNGALLGRLQTCSPDAYGIDLVRALASAALRPGSTVYGSLFEIPFEPRQFDLVICHGVIHHTDDAARAFACIAEQVAEGGTFSLTLYEPGIKGALHLRRLLPRSWSYPEPVLLGLSSVLGLPRAALECLRAGRFRRRDFSRHLGNARLSIFDVISPRWTSLHPSEEVTGWFEDQGLSVRRLGPGHYVGRREREGGTREIPDGPGAADEAGSGHD
jgi:SAM-dependent methyltransferase